MALINLLKLSRKAFKNNIKLYHKLNYFRVAPFHKSFRSNRRQFSSEPIRNDQDNKEILQNYKQMADKSKELNLQAKELLKKNFVTNGSFFTNFSLSLLKYGMIFGFLLLMYKILNDILDQYQGSGIIGKNNTNFEEIPPTSTNDDELNHNRLFKDMARDSLNEKKIDFSSVCGCQEVKEQLKDIVEFLRNPERFNSVNAKMPRGILLSGPPGCGKTLMARALAGEANVTFFNAAGSSFDEMFVGLGASRVRKLFKRARETSPCIIFIDELDSIGQTRNKLFNSNTTTLNQILSEIDGFQDNEGIIVIGATNLPEQLDTALTRSGRFDRKVEVQLPDKFARKELLELNLKGRPFHHSVDLNEIALQTVGLSCADIVNMVNMAAIESLKHNEKGISQKSMLNAFSQISLGKIRTSLHLSNNVIYNTAVHEAGHTVAALFCEHAPPVNQLTVLPRGQSLGSTWLTPKEGTQYSMTREEILGRIDVAMGGHAAEELVFGMNEVTTGASSDFQNATVLALMMIAQFGMSKSIGKFSVDPEDYINWSPFLKKKVMKEARSITDDAYLRAKKSISLNKSVLDKLVGEVIRRETLSKDDIYRLAGLERKGSN